MTYKYIFDPIALIEYLEAIEWYGERSIISLNNFLTSINAKIKDICQTPTLYRPTYRNYREVSLRKFPYTIIYLINERTKTIVISSIYHHKRNPNRKYKK